MVSIFSGVRGYLDKIEVADVTRFDAAMLDDLRANGQDILRAIRDEKELSEETEGKLKTFLDGFAKTFS